jgi:hypothetical protein
MDRIHVVLDGVKWQILCEICNESQGSTNAEPLKRQKDFPHDAYVFQS